MRYGSRQWNLPQVSWSKRRASQRIFQPLLLSNPVESFYTDLYRITDCLSASFICRDLKTGNVVSNISTSIGFGFGASFVDYTASPPMLWVFGTVHDRTQDTKPHPLPRPHGPPALPKNCGWSSMTNQTCGGVWAFWSTDLVHWHRAQTDAQWSGPNVDVASVIGGPRPDSHLPDHRFVMTTEDSRFLINNRLAY
jgi:hypothetical protein